VSSLGDLVIDDHRPALAELQRRALPVVDVAIPPTEELVTRALEVGTGELVLRMAGARGERARSRRARA